MQTQDYVNLLPAPNTNKPKLSAWAAALIQPSVDIQSVLNSYTDAFNIDNAVGDQMDRIGELLGVSRITIFQPDGGVSSRLTDDDYRLALKAKIIQNQWKGTKDEIYDFWAIYFPTTTVLINDNQDMTMDVLVFGMEDGRAGIPFFGHDEESDSIKGWDEGYWDYFTGLKRALVVNGYFVPKPAGVKVNYTFIDTPVFAHDCDSALLKGWDEGSWASF